MKRGPEKEKTQAVARMLEDANNLQRAFVTANQSTARLIRRRVTSGEVVEPYRNIFMAHADWNGLDLHERVLYVLRALVEIHPNWIFCHLTAGIVHGLELGLYSSDDFDAVLSRLHIVSTANQSDLRTPTVVRHHNCYPDYEVIEGVPVTPYWYTVFDCMAEARFGRALAIADNALRTTGVSRTQMIEQLNEVGYHRQGVMRVRKTARLADGASENGGESIVRAHIWYLGFAMPKLQVVVVDPLDPTRTFRIDLAWILPNGQLIACELDGEEKYQNKAMTGGATIVQVILKERRREARLTIRASKIIRISYDEACNLEFLEMTLEKYGVPRERHNTKGLLA